MQKKINQFQSQSALKLEQENEKRRHEELAFERKKHEQEAALKALCLEQEAAVALAQASSRKLCGYEMTNTYPWKPKIRIL